MWSHYQNSQDIDDLISNFKSVLSTQPLHVIKAMWGENALLRDCFSGNEVDFDNLTPPERVIYLENLISNFKSALASHCEDVIKSMWDGNPLLRDWYSGKLVNFGDEAQPDWRAISEEELIDNFKSALSSLCKDVIKAIWNGNQLLRNRYSGEQGDFGNQIQTDLRAFLEDLISNFKSVLASRCKDIIKAMWDGNLLLRNWYSGKLVNFGNQTQRDWHAISLEDLISNFKSALASRNIDVIKATWDGNPRLQDWYSGKQMNFGNLAQPDWRTISEEELINDFKSALSSQTCYVIKAMWDESALLRDCFSGKQVDFGNLAPPERVIYLENLISNFKAALASHCEDVFKAMWDGNPLLQNWYSGKQVNFGDEAQPDWRAISEEELISNFKSVLATQKHYVSKAMWGGSALLRDCFSGKQVDFGNLTPPERVITLKNLISNFKSALASHCEDVIKAMWDENPLLRNWYSGKQVDFGNQAQSDWRAISREDLISYFKSVLASRCEDVIKAMWNENLLLQNRLKKLDIKEALLILKKVFTSSKQCKSDFILQYVNWIDDIKLIQLALGKNCENKKISSYSSNQISILQDRHNALSVARLDMDLLNPIMASMVNPIMASTVNPPLHIEKSKRKHDTAKDPREKSSKRRKKSSSNLANKDVVTLDTNSANELYSSTMRVNSLLADAATPLSSPVLYVDVEDSSELSRDGIQEQIEPFQLIGSPLVDENERNKSVTPRLLSPTTFFGNQYTRQSSYPPIECDFDWDNPNDEAKRLPFYLLSP